MQKQNKAKFRSFTKRLQCIMSAVLMLLMTLSAVPVEAFADDDEVIIEKYGIWIQEVRATSENASDILGNGVFSYDAKNKKLTIEGNYDSDSNWSIIDNRSVEDLKIYVASDSYLTKTITGSSAVSICADTTITGPGMLTVDSDHAAFEIRNGATLTMSNAQIKAIENSSDACPAIYFNTGYLVVNYTDLTAVCSKGSGHYAIGGYDESKITLSDCSIAYPYEGYVQDNNIVDADGNIADKVEIEKNITSYPLRICGQVVNDENAADILGDGVFSYNTATKMLTINGDCNYGDPHYDLIDGRVEDLIIYVASDSHLTMLPGSGVLEFSASTTITGPGILTVESGREAISIYGGRLTISDAVVNVICHSTDPQYAVVAHSGMLSVVSSDFKVTCEEGALAVNFQEDKMELADCNIVIPQEGRIQDGTIIDSEGNIAKIIEIKSDPRNVKYSVIPNSKTIKKDCYNDSDYLAGLNGKLKFSAAGNERESGQIILNSNKRINDITVDITDLTGPNGSIIPSSNIEVFFEQYIYEKETQKWLLMDVKGWHADALLPHDLAKELGMNRLETAYGNNQGIWFTLNVPAEQTAGTYNGEIRINYDGGSIPVSVEVTVYNFDLPDQTYSRNHFHHVLNYDFVFDYDKRLYNDDDTLLISARKSMAGIDKDINYMKEVNDFINVRKLTTGHADTKRQWNVLTADYAVASTDQLLKYPNVDGKSYADAIYDYVKNSESPYYNLELCYTEVGVNPILDKISFDITKDFVNNGSAAIDRKNTEIKAAFQSIKGRELSENENKAIDFAVNTYLYFGLKYFSGTLTADERKYIVDINIYDGYTSDNGTIHPGCKETYEAQKNKLAFLNNKYRMPHWHYKPDLNRLYRGLILSGYNEGIELASYANNMILYYQYDFSSSNYIFFGMETVLKSLIKKSFQENTDLLKYAYLYCPRIDEPDCFDYWKNYEVLLNDKILYDSKQAVKKFINENSEYSNHPMKAEIISSIDNILFLPTTAATKEPKCNYQLGYFHKEVKMYSSMLYKGIGYFDKNDIIEKMPCQVYKNGFELETTKEGKKVFPESDEYSVKIESNYTVKNYCPLFNDFARPLGSDFEAKDYEGTKEALNDDNVQMWWYSCQSSANPLLPGYNLGGNVYDSNKENDETIKEKRKALNIEGNSLAIIRANKWQQFKLGIKGELYWAVDEYRHSSSDIEYNKDVWLITNYSCNEGSLIYPVYSLLRYTLGKSDDDAKTACDTYGYFASSIRLENLSEGNDDYDYLCIANDLLKKAALAGEPTENIEYWKKYINGLYDSMFDDMNYDENANSENLRIAREKLAKFIENYQLKVRKAAVYEIIPGGCDKIDIKFACNKDGGYLSDFIHLDFTDCTASIGTLTKKGNVYEYVLPVVDLPTTTEPISDFKEIYPAYFKIDGNNNIATDNNSISFFRKDTVDLVTPLRSSGYTVNRFWNKLFDESYSDWKTSGKAITFEIKATPLNCEKIKDNEDNIKTKSSIYFNQASPWRGTTKPVDLDPVEGTYNGIKGEQLDHGWYRITIPFSRLEEQSSDVAKNTIDMIEATWINKSFAIRNISISDAAAQPPTEIRPVNRTVWGDANCDGGVDLSDAILIMQSIANPNKYGLGGTAKTAITEKGKMQADVDTSVKGVTGNDAVMIQKYLLKLISSLDPSE